MYHGHVDRAQLKSLMHKSQVGILNFLPEPNHIEAQPNKLFEYMSAGLPVIGSNFPLWREIIETNDCGVAIDPLDTKELKVAIDDLIRDPNEASRKGLNGMLAVKATYNWQNEVEKLRLLYSNLSKVS